MKNKYDLSILNELGDRDSILEVLSLFLDNTLIEAKLLPRLLEQNNWIDLSKLAHKVKGAISLLQAKELVELLSKIEEKARVGKQNSYLSKWVHEAAELLNEIEVSLVIEREKLKNDKP